MCFKTIKQGAKKVVKPIKEVFRPTSRRQITIGRLKKILRERFPEGEIYLADALYDLCDIQDIETFLDMDETNHRKYLDRVHDCDDFARILDGQLVLKGFGGFAIGRIWTDVHAMNVMVDSNEDVWLIEPQSDKRRGDLLDSQGTKSRVIMI